MCMEIDYLNKTNNYLQYELLNDYDFNTVLSLTHLVSTKVIAESKFKKPLLY